jgi:transposase-like protein
MTKTQLGDHVGAGAPAEKERIVAAALAAGATIPGVGRESGVHASQVFRRRQQLCDKVLQRQASLRCRSPDQARQRLPQCPCD